MFLIIYIIIVSSLIFFLKKIDRSGNNVFSVIFLSIPSIFMPALISTFLNVDMLGNQIVYGVKLTADLSKTSGQLKTLSDIISTFGLVVGVYSIFTTIKRLLSSKNIQHKNNELPQKINPENNKTFTSFNVIAALVLITILIISYIFIFNKYSNTDSNIINKNSDKDLDLDPSIVNLAKSIRVIETGNDENYEDLIFNGPYKYIPSKFESQSKLLNGKDLNGQPLDIKDQSHQNLVFYTWAKNLLDKGYTIKEIASVWRYGEYIPKNDLEKYQDTPYIKSVIEQYLNYTNFNF